MSVSANKIDDLIADLIEFLLAEETPITGKLGGETVTGAGSELTPAQAVANHWAGV